MNKNIYLMRPFAGEEEIKAIKKVFKSKFSEYVVAQLYEYKRRQL